MLRPGTPPSRSSEESFCFSAWETPRLSVAESIGKDNYLRPVSSRTQSGKKATKRHKNAPHYSPRSAGSACRPQRSEHVTELIRFFKSCELPISDPYNFDLDSLELNGHIRQLNHRQDDMSQQDDSVPQRKKSPVKLFAPDLWSRAPARKTRQKNDRLNPATSMESMRYSPGTRSPRGSHDSNIDRPIATPKTEVDGECAYPGISVLPSSKEPHSNDIGTSEPFPSLATMGQLYDLSSATLTGDMYTNEKMEWTDTSVGREILSGIDTDSGMPIQPMPVQPNNPSKKNGANVPQPPAKPAVPHNCAKGATYWPQEKPLPDTPEDHCQQPRQQIQIYKRDSIRVTRSTTTSSGYSKRHSISTTCESTFIDVQCLPERTSSRKARRAGRTDFSNLCCRLSCPMSEEHTFDYAESLESADKPASMLDPVDASENLDPATQSKPKSRTLIPAPIDSSRKYSVSSEPSLTPSSNIFSISALSGSASSSTLTSPLTWHNSSQKGDDHEPSKSMPSTPALTVSHDTLDAQSKVEALPKVPMTNVPEIKGSPDTASKILPAHFPSVPVRKSSRLDNIHALRMKDVAAARAALKVSNNEAADNIRGRQASSPAILNYPLPAKGSSRTSEESLPSPTSFTAPTIKPPMPSKIKVDPATESPISGSPTRTIMPDGSVFTDRAMKERSFRHKHNAFSLLAGGSLPSSPRNSQSFIPAPAPQRPSLMSPKSVAGLRALESVSRPVSPSLPSSDDEGMGTRAHSGRSRRSTRSTRRSRKCSTLTIDHTKAQKYFHDEPLPLTPPSANAIRPNDPDSLLSPYTPTHFKYLATSDSSITTQSHQQKFLQDRVFYLERQNKMLQSALLSALEVGAKCDAQRDQKCSPRSSNSVNYRDDIIDMLNLYRNSYDGSCGVATSSASAIRRETRHSAFSPGMGETEISCSSTTTSRLSIQGKALVRPSTSPSTAKERAHRRLIEPHNRISKTITLR
ncbi:hypothetical protein MGYG_01356 [Nannizzia gypsea CBS 118893]|uniref:Uncharacterized protein n=1 Tax=Arthroderma gypseum (strain ATCC MYA-4604 / CBS 118893) TaxID=535722 RepID=E5R0C7_ARTGP|nr:hypothetical protein MGYG_01356 [Nannizzia gypsea CBS 118893]EFQ98323.1 hypothetical protein MGYG_01356 [Nannizzia gypsea CBS 118893]